MAVTGSEGLVIQRFKKSAVDATSVTLVPTTGAWAEAKPSHLAATEVVLTFSARPELKSIQKAIPAAQGPERGKK